ncbi:MAG: hypothetical protein ACTHK8_19020 [Ginsengibacter sp.]
MSLRTFLHKIWAEISALWHQFDPILQKAIHIGAQVTEAVKDFDVANPIAADILTALIPGDLDDIIKQKIREALPKIVVELRLVDNAAGLTDPNEIMQAAVKVIQQLDGDYKSAFLHDFAIIVSQVAADGKLTWGDAVYLLQWYYQHKFKQ